MRLQPMVSAETGVTSSRRQRGLIDLLTHLFVKPAPFYLAQDHPPNVPAPLGYAPCYGANLAAPSFGNRDEKDELQ